MKIVLFDSILERHLCESLERAFIYLGHTVVSTGLILHSHSMIDNSDDVKVIEDNVEKYIDKSVDLVIVFRPMNLTSEIINKIKKNAVIAVWLSDDPVLYNMCYSSVVDKYDLILHCGNKKILEFYKNKGHKNGINFPFWTDNIAFPYTYMPEYSLYDGVFLGNMHGEVRHKRYSEISELECSIKIFGLIESDYLGFHGGNIRDGYIKTSLISEKLKSAKFGISIPQFFDSYINVDQYYFDGLENLGYFQFPSRIIQYAASGLPIVSLGDSEMKEVFPEIEVSPSISKFSKYVKNVCHDFDFALDESKKIHSRFLKDFSAMSRAKFLIQLVERPESYLKESLGYRSTSFTRF